jgi:hypothetical protein
MEESIVDREGRRERRDVRLEVGAWDESRAVDEINCWKCANSVNIEYGISNLRSCSR